MTREDVKKMLAAGPMVDKAVRDLHPRYDKARGFLNSLHGALGTYKRLTDRQREKAREILIEHYLGHLAGLWEAEAVEEEHGIGESKATPTPVEDLPEEIPEPTGRTRSNALFGMF